jgi:hypothetical protein
VIGSSLGLGGCLTPMGAPRGLASNVLERMRGAMARFGEIETLGRPRGVRSGGD